MRLMWLAAHGGDWITKKFEVHRGAEMNGLAPSHAKLTEKLAVIQTLKVEYRDAKRIANQH